MMTSQEYVVNGTVKSKSFKGIIIRIVCMSLAEITLPFRIQNNNIRITALPDHAFFGYTP